MDNFRGDLGEDGFEPSSDLGVLAVSVGVVVLAWSLELSSMEGVWAAATVVRQRKLGLETGWDCSLGVEVLLPLENNPNFVPLLGLGLGLGVVCRCLSPWVAWESRWMVVQKALRQPVPIFRHQRKGYLSLLYVDFVDTEKKWFCLRWIWCWHRRQKGGIELSEKSMGSNEIKKKRNEKARKRQEVGLKIEKKQQRESRGRQTSFFLFYFLFPFLALSLSPFSFLVSL